MQLPPMLSNQRFAKNMSILMLIGMCAIPATLVGGLRLSVVPPVDAQVTSGCGLANAAFCETFNAPAGTGNRSGALNGTVWGVSRTGQQIPQPPNTWNTSALHPCGVAAAFPPHDINICNGQLVDSLSDGGEMILAMYPKQPFDIAGRTGKVTFDVNADSQGIHAAWPAFVYTDQPVPAPSGKEATVEEAFPRNSFGFTLAHTCDAGSNCGPNCPYPSPNGTTVDLFWITQNYVDTELAADWIGCVEQGSPGALNHFEVDISATGATVYGTQPGTTGPLIALASVSVTMPLSRGLIWIEDVHYNACKFNSQCDHSYTWDNVGFDGPLLPRDLTFDVLDASQSCDPSGSCPLGWTAPTPPLSTLPITQSNIAAASGAAVLFNWFPTGAAAAVSVQLNGATAHQVGWPFQDSTTYVWRTIAVPVPLAEVRAGANTIAIATNSGGQDVVSNVDLALIGAGGIVPCNCGGPTPTPTPSPTQTATASPTPTSSASATPTVTHTPTPSPTHTPTPTLTPTVSPTGSATPKPSVVTSATASPTSVAAGGTVTITASVTSAAAMSALVDVEIFNPAGQQVSQSAHDNQSFTAGQARTFTSTWVLPTSGPSGVYTVKIGVFSTGWGTLYSWNDNAAQFSDPSPTPTPPPSVGFTTSATASPNPVGRGSQANISVSVLSAAAGNALVDIEVYSPGGQKVFQKFYDNQAFTAGQTLALAPSWRVSRSAQTGTYTVKIGVFGVGWEALEDWNDDAGQFSVN